MISPSAALTLARFLYKLWLCLHSIYPRPLQMPNNHIVFPFHACVGIIKGDVRCGLSVHFIRIIPEPECPAASFQSYSHGHQLVLG